jgi:GcrA cell cycle regulator
VARNALHYCSLDCSRQARREARAAAKAGPDWPRCAVCAKPLAERSTPYGTCSRHCGYQLAAQHTYGPTTKQDVAELWCDTALSAREIGLRVRPQLSKNAVIGLVHRMGLPARPSPIKGVPFVGVRNPKTTLPPLGGAVAPSPGCSGDGPRHPVLVAPGGHAKPAVTAADGQIIAAAPSVAFLKSGSATTVRRKPPGRLAAQHTPTAKPRAGGKNLPRATIPRRELVRFDDMPSATGCQYPTGEKPFRMCEAVREIGTPYCTAHAALCYHQRRQAVA